jgi:hypothetical protein
MAAFNRNPRPQSSESAPIAPAFYVMLGTAIGLVAAFFLVDRTREVRLSAVEPVRVNVTAA